MKIVFPASRKHSGSREFFFNAIRKGSGQANGRPDGAAGTTDKQLKPTLWTENKYLGRHLCK